MGDVASGTRSRPPDCTSDDWNRRQCREGTTRQGCEHTGFDEYQRAARGRLTRRRLPGRIGLVASARIHERRRATMPNASQSGNPPLSARRGFFHRVKDRLWGYDFFISYEWGTGNRYAVALAQRLRDRGFDVFLDRAEYAMGDDWKTEGHRALWNTQRLIVIATREAVTRSKPVEREVEIFTARSNHVILIVFGDELAELIRDEWPVLQRIPESCLRIADSTVRLSKSPAIHVVKKLVSTDRILRRRVLRARIVASVIAMSAVAVIVIGFFWRRAVEQEQLAQTRLRDAQAVASEIIFHIDVGLREIPEATPTRHALLSNCTVLLDALLTNAADDDNSLRLRGAQHILSGHEALWNNDLATAEKEFQESVEICRKRIHSHPNDGAFGTDLAVSLQRLGDVSVLRGDVRSAKRLYGESFALRLSIANATPYDAVVQEDLSASLVRLGGIQVKRGEFESGQGSYEKALEIRRELAKRRPADSAIQFTLWELLVKLGELAARSKDFKAASASFEEALTVASSLSKREPHIPKFQYALSGSLVKLADLAFPTNSDMAGRMYMEAERLMSALLVRNPENDIWRHDWISMRSRLVESLMKNGKPKESHRIADENLNMLRALVSNDPTNIAFQRDLAIGLETVGRLTLIQSEDGPKKSLRFFDEAVTIMRGLTATNDNYEMMLDSVARLSMQAIACQSAGMIERARSSLDEAIRQLEKFANRNEFRDAELLAFIREGRRSLDLPRGNEPNRKQ
jgi:tetratricopeptide (TPR) repeat protein